MVAEGTTRQPAFVPGKVLVGLTRGWPSPGAPARQARNAIILT